MNRPDCNMTAIGKKFMHTGFMPDEGEMMNYGTIVSKQTSLYFII